MYCCCAGFIISGLATFRATIDVCRSRFAFFSWPEEAVAADLAFNSAICCVNMAMLWRVIPAHVYVAALVFSWGVTASSQAVAVNYPMLVFLRFLLGIGEAGFTGVPYYLSFFFKRHELAFRTAIFVSGTFAWPGMNPFFFVFFSPPTPLT